MKTTYIAIVLLIITTLVFCNVNKQEEFEADYECSIKAKAECQNGKLFFYYSVAFDRLERLIIESEFWIRQDATTYCLAAKGSEWSQGNQIRKMDNLRIIDSSYFKRMIDCNDTSDLRINVSSYEQSLNDYQNKSCSTSFFYIK